MNGRTMRGDAIDPIGITVVTIALNAASALPLTLESVIAQDYGNLEIAVVDGMSWDGTGRVLDRYAPLVDSIVVEEDAGIYHAMNRAAERATKDFVIFMNAGDQFFCEDAISRMVRGVREDTDIFYGNHIYDFARLELFKRSADFSLISERLAAGRVDIDWLESIPCHQATFTRTALLRKMRFDTRLRVSADHELLFRAHEAGARMVYVDELVARYFGGGYSAAMGERTRLEGASVYRRFSDRPDLVDKFFYPHGSPYDPQTERTGIKLCGFYPPLSGSVPEGSMTGGDHVAAAGCSFVSSTGESAGLELTGHSGVDDQTVSLLANEEEIGSAPLPRGSFRLEIDFSRPVPGRSVVMLRPSRAHALSAGTAAASAFTIRSFRFYDAEQRGADRLAPGQSLFFRNGNISDFRAALGTGWSDPETTHLWSLGPRSELWLKASAETDRLTFTISGNPHVEGGRQQVAFLVNGVEVASGVTERGGQAIVELPCHDDIWRRGQINRVEIRPSQIGTPPAGSGDTRMLGICLWRMDVA